METWNGEKERQKERGEEKQTLAIFTCFGDFKIMPIFCADNLEMHAVVWFQPRAAFYLASPQEGREVRSSHQFSYVVFTQVWCLSLRTQIPNAGLILLSGYFISYFLILILLICEEKQN